MCKKKYVISGLAACEPNKHVMLEVNGVMYNFMYENGSLSSMMWYYISVTGSYVHCFDCLLSFILYGQKICKGTQSILICLDQCGQFFMKTGIGRWGNWQSTKAIFDNAMKFAAFIEFDGVYGSWSLVALLAACDKA